MSQDTTKKNLTLVKLSIVGGLLLILTMIPGLLKAQSIIDEIALLKNDTTEPEQVSLEIIRIRDPRGHGCCVIAPPNLIEIFLIEGDLVLREMNNGNAIPWLDFDPMRLDSNNDFVSESRATVAGFSNILTVLSGNVTSDGITGTFSIGAAGGLPGGDPISYDFSISAAEGLDIFYPETSFLAVHLSAGFVADIIDIREDEEKPEEFFLLLQDDLGLPEADWWLVTLSGGEIRSFDPNTLTFQPGLRPTLQGPTTDIPEPIKFMDLPADQSEQITVFFGVDAQQNGLVDEDSLVGVGYTLFFN